MSTTCLTTPEVYPDLSEFTIPAVLNFDNLGLEFVSDFEIRISDLTHHLFAPNKPNLRFEKISASPLHRKSYSKNNLSMIPKNKPKQTQFKAKWQNSRPNLSNQVYHTREHLPP